MKAKHALIILVIGYCLDFIGALYKLEHWENGDNILVTATIFKVVGAIIFLIKLLTHPKVKEFLNR